MAHLFLLMTALGTDGDEKSFSSLINAANYQFRFEESGPPSPPVEGKFQKGLPVHFRADGIEFYRAGEVLVYKDKDAWQRTRTGTLSDPLRILGPSAKVRAARLPHEELAQLDKFWTAVRKSKDGKGQTLLTGDLDEKGAKALARSENRPVAQGGKAQVWLDAKGQVVRYQITIRLLGRLGDAEVDGTATKAVAVSRVGTTKVEVPAEAKKVLE